MPAEEAGGHFGLNLTAGVQSHLGSFRKPSFTASGRGGTEDASAVLGGSWCLLYMASSLAASSCRDETGLRHRWVDVAGPKPSVHHGTLSDSCSLGVRLSV